MDVEVILRRLLQQSWSRGSNLNINVSRIKVMSVLK